MGLWTQTHAITILPAFAVFAVFAFLLGRALRNKDERVRYIPLQIIAVVLLLLEVGKQGVSIANGYDPYHIPLHYCSLYLYLLPMHAFYRGKHRATVDACAFGCTASLVAFMLIMPAVVYGDWNIKGLFNSYFDFHTVVFHNLVCLYFFLTVALRLQPAGCKRDTKVLAAFMTAYVAVAAVVANVTQVNYQNMYRCNLGIGEEIRQALCNAIGWPGQLIYVTVLGALTVGFTVGSYLATRALLALPSRLRRPADTPADKPEA